MAQRGQTRNQKRMSSASRRRFIAATAARLIGAPSFVRAAAESAALEILVDNGRWGAATPGEIRAIALSAANEIWPYCAGERIKPIRIYHRDDFPLTDFVHDWRGRICIGLHDSEAHWMPQMAFQFGHEFCHALAQHSAIALRGWHPPRHANLWFEESLCETGSLFVLRRLAVTWQQHAPSEAWRGFAPAMSAYAVERLAKPEHQLPADTTFAAWFHLAEPALRENSMLRAQNVIIARQMLPLFETEPSGWDALCYLNLGAHQQGKALAQHLAEWQSNSPAAVRPFVARVAALFAG
jgi:hypothetical protein